MKNPCKDVPFDSRKMEYRECDVRVFKDGKFVRKRALVVMPVPDSRPQTDNLPKSGPE